MPLVPHDLRLLLARLRQLRWLTARAESENCSASQLGWQFAGSTRVVKNREWTRTLAFHNGVSRVLGSRLLVPALCLFSAFFSVSITTSRSADACDHCIARAKAQQQASEGRMRHVGGSLGSGGYEGVGFSTRSADDAIRKCCYWGQRSPVGIGVARGNNGWYATVLYR